MQDGFATAGMYGRLHYLEAGSGRPLILLHSNGNSSHEYRQIIEILTKKYRVIAWDQPGQGDSDRITRHHSIEDYADAVIAFMDALGIGRASVLGASIGAMICTDLGVRHSERIDRLFVVEPPARTEAEWIHEWPRTEINRSQPTQVAAQLTPRMRTVSPETLQRWNIDRNKAGAWTMVDGMWALRLYNSRAAIPGIKTKTMAIFGENNALKTFAPLFQSGVRDIEVRIMTDCGHFPMRDDPEGLSKIIEEFMES